MQSIKSLISSNAFSIQSKNNLGRYVIFVAGTGLTTASFLVSGGSLALVSSGIMCGAGLKMVASSLKPFQSGKEEAKGKNEWNQLIRDTSLGALNGFISSIGWVCIEQEMSEQCDHLLIDTTPKMIASHALFGLVTGTINGTINAVIKNEGKDCEEGIELKGVGKTGFMEMGSNIVTAVGRATLFKSAVDKRRKRNDIWSWKKTGMKRLKIRNVFGYYKKKEQNMFLDGQFRNVQNNKSCLLF